MAAAGAGIPPEFVEQFERLGEPVVIHRLTRFDDPELRRAAREWLSQRQAEREARQFLHRRDVARRLRRRTVLFAAAMILVWTGVILFFLLR
jgi:hypothetical protein